MAVLRTPEQRFEGLPGYPFAPHYVEVGGYRMHYVDEGKGAPFLLLHGEPSWSYLYRKMIPLLAGKGRVVAPDFIGFGKSDKLSEVSDYTYGLHRDSLKGFIEKLDLHGITMVVQDWGGLVGLRVAGMVPERIARLVIMNTGLPTGDIKMPEAFMRWREFVEKVPDLPVGMIIMNATVLGRDLPKDILAAYEAPFPDASYKAGAKAWPLMVPVKPDDPASADLRQAVRDMGKWTKPALVMFSDQDPITRGGERFFRALIPGSKGQPDIEIKDGGHFLQEDKGEEIAGHILDFIKRTR